MGAMNFMSEIYGCGKAVAKGSKDMLYDGIGKAFWK